MASGTDKMRKRAEDGRRAGLEATRKVPGPNPGVLLQEGRLVVGSGVVPSLPDPSPSLNVRGYGVNEELKPADDIEHEESEDCPCGPDVEFVEGGVIVIHHSLDGRERFEDADGS